MKFGNRARLHRQYKINDLKNLGNDLEQFIKENQFELPHGVLSITLDLEVKVDPFKTVPEVYSVTATPKPKSTRKPRTTAKTK